MPRTKLKVKLFDCTVNPGAKIDQIARRSTAREDDTGANPNLLKNLALRKHHGCFEFAHIVFDVRGISRSLTHQLVRHRMFSYLQESQRYVTIKDFDFITPHTIKELEKANMIYHEVMNFVDEKYAELLELGIPKQDARYILPNAVDAPIYVGGNARMFHEFLQKRLDPHAQWEIREMAYQMWRHLYKLIPDYFSQSALGLQIVEPMEKLYAK